MSTTVRPRSLVRLSLIALLLAAVTAGFLALGVWQLQRRIWKLDLIAAVQQRVHAAPIAAPGPDAWPRIDTRRDAYRRVRAAGVFLNDREKLVQAVTEKGAGFWVMTPLRTDQGFTVLVNRGFAPAERSAATARTQDRIDGQAAVIGLLRISEPGGGFLRHNQPAANRWYSRDVAAIARSDGLVAAAPYFIDADARPNPGGWPLGGLTVIQFPNSHLIYAIIWFGLAAMTAGWTAAWARAEWRRRQGA